MGKTILMTTRASARLRFGAFVLPLLLGAGSARAQGLPFNIGDAVRDAQQAQQAAPRPPSAGPLVLPKLVEAPFTMASGETLLIRQIAVSGTEGLLVDQAALRATLAPYEGRKLTLAQIYEAADKVTALYREQGYLVAKAYVPAQDARSGALKFALLPGRYGEVAIRNQSPVQDWILRGILDRQRVQTGALIEKDGLERGMLLISDLHGANMPRAVMGAGGAQGASDFQFEVPEQRRIDGFALMDNFGTNYTGLVRSSVGFDANSLLGLGDRLTAFGMLSTGDGLLNGRVAYSMPLGYDGLRAEASVFRTTYVLGGIYQNLDSTGVADGASATLAYPLRRTRDDSIWLSATYAYKNLNDFTDHISYAHREINEGLLTLNRDANVALFGHAIVTSSSLAFTFGEVFFPQADQFAANLRGAGTAGDFSKLSGSFVATVALADQWSASINARGQLSFTGNLDTSEQFSLTGAYGVRSFFEGLSGDSGWLVTPEIKYALPDVLGWRHAVSAFADGGGAALANGAYTILQPSYVQLADVGLGYYGSYEYSPGRLIQVKAYLAQTVGGAGGMPSYDRGTVGLVQGGFTF
jgi:hemolysin activation/secretion protein